MEALDEDDYYDVLGVALDATSDEIKLAYRRRARVLHPDHNKASDAHDSFVKLQLAYECLIDPDSRAHYDRTGSAPELRNVEPKAREYIMREFLNLARSQKFTQNKYITIIRDMTFRIIEAGQRALEDTRSVLQQLDRAMPIATRAGEDNMFALLIENERKHLNEQAETIVHDLEMYAYAIRILDRYEDQLPPPQLTAPGVIRYRSVFWSNGA